MLHIVSASPQCMWISTARKEAGFFLLSPLSHFNRNERRIAIHAQTPSPLPLPSSPTIRPVPPPLPTISGKPDFSEEEDRSLPPPPPPVPVFIAGNRARGALCCPTLSHAGRAASPSLFLFAWRSVIGNNMAAAVKIVVVLTAIVSTGR